MIDITPQYLREQGTFLERFWSKVDKNGPIPDRCPDLGPCWVWTASNHIFLNRDSDTGRPVTIYPSRASYIINVGHIPNRMEVCHHCDHGTENELYCVNPEHLFLDTHEGNMKDMVSKGRGRGLVGEDHNMAKLTDADVMLLRKLYSPVLHNGHELGRRFGINTNSVYRIIKGETWAHLPLGEFGPDDDLTWTVLTQEKADEIREAYARGETTYRALAKQYRVSNGTIQAVLMNRTWVK